MATLIQHAHVINMRYRGATDSRGPIWTFRWEGWPGDDFRSVDQHTSAVNVDEGLAAITAVKCFIEWIGDGPMAGKPRLRTNKVTLVSSVDSNWTTHVIFQLAWD